MRPRSLPNGSASPAASSSSEPCRSFLKSNKQEGVTESLNLIYEKQDDRVGLDPVLEHLQGASISREEW